MLEGLTGRLAIITCSNASVWDSAHKSPPAARIRRYGRIAGSGSPLRIPGSPPSYPVNGIKYPRRACIPVGSATPLGAAVRDLGQHPLVPVVEHAPALLALLPAGASLGGGRTGWLMQAGARRPGRTARRNASTSRGRATRSSPRAIGTHASRCHRPPCCPPRRLSTLATGRSYRQ